MALPNIHTTVVHSESKPAWNIISTQLGDKYKIARVPYVPIVGSNELTERERNEALEHAMFISTCFNVAYMDEKNKHLGIPIYNNTHPYDEIDPKDLPF